MEAKSKACRPSGGCHAGAGKSQNEIKPKSALCVRVTPCASELWRMSSVFCNTAQALQTSDLPTATCVFSRNSHC